MTIRNGFKDFYDRFLSLRGDPRTIAMGMAVGIFIGTTPTIPFHTALIVLWCLLWKNNLTAAYLGLWLISNPITIPILYLSQYELGRFLLGMTQTYPVLTDYSLGSILSSGWQMTLPLMTGGMVMAPFFAIPAYFIIYRMTVSLRQRSKQ